MSSAFLATACCAVSWHDLVLWSVPQTAYLRVFIKTSVSDHMKKLENFLLDGDNGYFDKEVNYAGSEALVGVKLVNVKPHVGPFIFPVVLFFSTSCTRCGHHRLCPRTSRFVSPVGHDVASYSRFPHGAGVDAA